MVSIYYVFQSIFQDVPELTNKHFCSKFLYFRLLTVLLVAFALVLDVSMIASSTEFSILATCSSLLVMIMFREPGKFTQGK